MANTFEDFIQGDTPVVVDFFAEWCNPCKRMQPILQEIKNTVGNSVTILKMDVDKNQYYANKYSIQSIPTMIIFKNGKIVWRKTGLIKAIDVIPQLALNVT